MMMNYLRKKTNLMFVVLFASLQGTMAQTAEDTVYVFKDDHANPHVFLPAFPDTASVEFLDDMLQFQWGKTQRGTARGEQASRESLWLPDAMRVMMAEVLSLDTISDEATPALSRLLLKSYWTGEQSVSNAKDETYRVRPFLRMNDPLWAAYETDYLRTNSSFPSGHTAFGWFTSLVFAEMWPELQDTILRRGFMFGENRVITGAHWQSDVTVGYLCAAAAVAQAHTNPELEKDILAARAEYAQLKGLPADYDPVTATDVPHGENILNPPVDTASYRYITDLTRHWDAKSQRYTERGKQAAIEAEYSVEMMHHVFGEAMGITISKESTPAICALIALVLEKSSETVDRLKVIRFRKRPFVQLGEPSFVPGDEEKERGKSSFPSGHTSLGWTEALTMAEVAPECRNEILRRGYQYGYNRLIVGYHWFTDIEITRLLSCALVARLHADPSFRQMIEQAREEYKQLTTGITPTPQQKPDRNTGAIYTIDGYLLDSYPAKKGIYISNGKKNVF